MAGRPVLLVRVDQSELFGDAQIGQQLGQLGRVARILDESVCLARGVVEDLAPIRLPSFAPALRLTSSRRSFGGLDEILSQ